MIYFVNCKTEQDIQQRYKQWAKVLHPDSGGNESDFKAMQKEYAELKNNNYRVEEKPKKVYVRQTVKEKPKPEELILFAGNILGLVKSGLELAKEINEYIKTEEKIENLKQKDNER